MLVTISVLAGVAFGANLIAALALGDADRRTTGANLHRAQDAMDAVTVAELVLLASLVAGFVLLVIWVNRMYRNLAAFGIRDLRFGEGWAVGAWFVPILNLARPKQIVGDIWRASDPDTSRYWRSRSEARLLNWWWGAWVGWGVISRAAAAGTSGAADDGADPGDLAFAYVARAAALVILLAGSALAIAVVLRLTDRHERRGDPAAHERRLGLTPLWLGTSFGIVAAVAGVAGFAALDEPAATATRDVDGAVVTPGRIQPVDLQVRDCFTLPGEDDVVIDVEVVPCTRPHDAQVAAVIRHEAPLGATFPGQELVFSTAEELCYPAVGDVLRAELLGTLRLYLFAPTRTSWSIGDRQILCAVIDVDQRPLTESVLTNG